MRELCPLLRAFRATGKGVGAHLGMSGFELVRS